MRRVLGSLAFAAVLSVLSACTAESGAEPDPVPGTTRAPVPEPSATTAAPGHEELAPGWDESPDGPTPTPDVELDDAALTALLRTRATAAGPDHCTADQVAVTLEGFDQAAGHRYSRLVVRNSGHEPCVVEGVPGVGARGAWGTTFVNEIGPGASGAPADPVRLAPGSRRPATSSGPVTWPAPSPSTCRCSSSSWRAVRYRSRCPRVSPGTPPTPRRSTSGR